MFNICSFPKCAYRSAAYVMGQPAVAEAFAAAEQDPTLLPDAIARRLAAQEALGIKPEDRRVLTKAEEQEIFEGIRNLTPEQQAAALASFRGRYGDGIGPVAAQLEEAGLPPSLAAHLDPSSDPASVRPVSEVPELPGGSFEGDIISETAQRLLAEGEAAGEPRAVEQDQSGIAAGQVTEPPLPRRKPGSGPHPAEQKLLDKYRLLMEADEATLREGLDASRVKGIEAIVESKVQEQGVRSEVAELTKRLALRNYRRGGGLESAASSALIETGIERPNLSLDPSRYMPRLTGDPIADAEAYMDRIGIKGNPPRDRRAAAMLVEFLREFSKIRELHRTGGEEGTKEFREKWKRVAGEGIKYGLSESVGFQLTMLSEELLESPYKYPWALTNIELGTAMAFLAARAEGAADEQLLKDAGNFVFDLIPVPPLLRKAHGGVKRILEGIGIIESISEKEAAKILASLVREAGHRRLIPSDRRLHSRIGIKES